MIEAYANNAIKDKLLGAILGRLERLSSEDIPFLFPKNEKGSTVFDDIVEDSKVQIASRFLSLMIAADSKGLLYGNLVRKNLQKLMSIGVDLKIYYESEMMYY